MAEIVVYSGSSSGASHTNDEIEIWQNLKARMNGHGGTKGLRVRYRAAYSSIDKQFQNFGHVEIVADSEKAAARYKAV